MPIDTLTYTIEDDWGQRTATISVTVQGGGVAFVTASDDAAFTLPGTAKLISPLVNDQVSAGAGPLRIAPGSVTTPSPAGSGTAVVQANQTDILYTPAGGFAGEATFNYDAQSTINTALRDTGLIRVTVTATQTLEYPVPVDRWFVNTQAEFDARLALSKGGDEIVVRCNLTALGPVRSGTPALPIVIRGDPSQQRTINGNVNFYGNDIQICDFRIADRSRVFILGARNRLHRCRVKYANGAGITCLASSDFAMISYCEIDGGFVQPTSVSWPGFDMVPTAFGTQNHIVRRCWLHTCIQRTGNGDDNSGFFCGTGQPDTDKQTGNIIEYVLIEDWNGDAESIANKCSNNTYRFVTLLNSKQFSNRHGNNNVWWGCWSQNSGGFDIFDANNSVLGCQVVGGGSIHASNGEVTAAGWPNNTGPTLGSHPQASNTIIAGCFGTVTVGKTSANASPQGYDEPALNTVIEANTPTPTAANFGDHVGTLVRPTLSAGRQVPTPIQITRAMVGVFTPWAG